MADLFPEGWEEHDRGGELELAVYAGRGAAGQLRPAFGNIGVLSVAGDWSERWRAFHRGARVGQLWVGPPWEPGPPDSIAVVIEPAQAFGTGAHPTTRLCLELLLGQPATSVADLGCGSGVLAVAAAKLGFSPVIALDRDPASVEATRANAAVNDVRVEAHLADVRFDELPGTDLGVANLERDLIPTVAGRFGGGRLIASGYLVGDVLRVPGWVSVLTRRCDGWRADLFERC